MREVGIMVKRKGIATGTLDWREINAGDTLYHVADMDSRGYPVKIRVTSVKRWKRDPNRFRIGVAYGLYTFWQLTAESDLWRWRKTCESL
jgi:hypothetical protein